MRQSNPVAINYEPQVSFSTLSPTLSGEEELIDTHDRSSEHACAAVEGPSYVDEHLPVLDPVHFATQTGGVGGEEVDFHCNLSKRII